MGLSLRREDSLEPSQRHIVPGGEQRQPENLLRFRPNQFPRRNKASCQKSTPEDKKYRPKIMKTTIFAQLSFSLIAASAAMTGILEVSSAQDINVQFRQNGAKGMSLFADGNPLTEAGGGAGHYLIGSTDLTDDGNNVSSLTGSGGLMRPLDSRFTTPTVPYTLTFTKDPQNPRRYTFSIVIGPTKDHFTSMSFPLDGLKTRFQSWRYEGSTNLRRYDSNPLTYTTTDGPVHIVSASGNPKWGEMVGPDYTVRYTVTSSSKPMTLFFVYHPSLGKGVTNLEFSFGEVKKGQSVSMTGAVEVSRTPVPTTPQAPKTFETESSGYHQIGRREGDGWSVKVGDPAGRFSNYGPYQAIASGSRSATFYLMLDNTTANNHKILTIDVFDSAIGRIVSTRDIYRKEFTVGPMRYQAFTLNFVSNANGKYEFRTYWWGGSYCRQDKVVVR